MSEREQIRMADGEFESMLKDSLPPLPPDRIAVDVNPWEAGMSRVLMGIALNAVHIDLLCLNYILPAIGTVKLLLGFRQLRHENRWFRACYYITLLQSLYFFPSLVLNAASVPREIFAGNYHPSFQYFSIALQLIRLLCMRQGFIAVQRKACLTPDASGATALIVWHIFVLGLALVNYSGLIISFMMLGGFIFILLSLDSMAKKMGQAGYAIKTKPVKIADGLVIFSILAFLAVGISCAFMFGSSYSVDWAPVDEEWYSHVEDIKSQLIGLGFPEAVIADLKEEDIAACDGALQVVVDVRDEPVNDGRKVTSTEYDADGTKYLSEKTIYDVKELHITSVGVQLPGDTWVMFHHFLWNEDPGFRGTEALWVVPAYQYSEFFTSCGGEAAGRVLYDKDGQRYAAPYSSIGEEAFLTQSLLGEAKKSTGIIASFSMPEGGENYRGYVTYKEERQNGLADLTGTFYYTHQRDPFQYPAMTAAMRIMSAGLKETRTFKTARVDLFICTH